jgi:hypothetical protein
MEITISAAVMQRLMEDSIKNADNYLFVDKRSEDLKQCIRIMESMGVRSIEVDLSSDDDSILADIPSPDYLSYAEQARVREKSGFGM